MKPRAATRRQQSGIALLMLLAILVAAGGYAFYRSTNLSNNRIQQITKLTTTLARAKETLIARAVIDANRPGSLPCPDLITNNIALNNTPGDGSTDLFTLTQCPSYIGWLPWATLDLPDLRDDSGERLWYALSRNLRDDDSAYPINSDTNFTLRIDGGGEIAAIIIAPGPPLAGQTRPSTNPSDYLEGENNNGDDNYISGPVSETFNDVIAIITRQELMAAVEKRVANELKTCIEQHAIAGGTYPWPAPFSSSSYQGKVGSYFGQLPATQTGAGPDQALQKITTEIQRANTALTVATQASEQLTAAQQLTEALTQARNLYDTIYVSSTTLWQSAALSSSNSTQLQNEITSDLKPSSTGRIAIIDSEQTRIRDQALILINQIDAVYKTIDETGLDFFPNQLRTLTLQFEQQRNANNALSIQQLLAKSSTNHADIGPALSKALNNSTTAMTAAANQAQTPTDSDLTAAAQISANNLLDSINALQTSIINSRINRHHSELNPYTIQLTSLGQQLHDAPSSINTSALTIKLAETKKFLESIKTGASAINSSRTSSLLAIDEALSAIQASTRDYPLIETTTNLAINAINALITTMIVNDDNLTRSSLAAAISDFRTQQIIFSSINITSTSDRVPYAVSLQNVTVDIEFWAKIITAEADSLARQTKGVPVALGEDFSKATPLAQSAYQIAETALNSSQTSVSALQSYLNTPTSARQAAATSALADTVTQTNNALSSAIALDASLSSSTASASPIVWLSSRCNAFRDTADSWWRMNEWKKLVFYQISDAELTATPGKLKVNQSGNYRIVVVNAGRTLSGQNRSARKAADYFEGINADGSRNNNAAEADVNFIAQPPDASFNDRLAY